jgi:hypothetical protein
MKDYKGRGAGQEECEEEMEEQLCGCCFFLRGTMLWVDFLTPPEQLTHNIDSQNLYRIKVVHFLHTVRNKVVMQY